MNRRWPYGKRSGCFEKLIINGFYTSGADPALARGQLYRNPFGSGTAAWCNKKSANAMKTSIGAGFSGKPSAGCHA